MKEIEERKSNHLFFLKVEEANERTNNEILDLNINSRLLNFYPLILIYRKYIYYKYI